MTSKWVGFGDALDVPVYSYRRSEETVDRRYFTCCIAAYICNRVPTMSSPVISQERLNPGSRSLVHVMNLRHPGLGLILDPKVKGQRSHGSKVLSVPSTSYSLITLC